jgi:hypothetical protein
MSELGLVTDAGRIYKARLLKGDDLPGLGWMAIGDATWGDKFTPPLETVDMVALSAEIGRKQVSKVAYLQVDAVLGTIPFKGTLYKEVPGPTKTIAFFAEFLENEGLNAQICQVGLFGGLVTTTSSPYATFAQVVVPGTLYWVRNRPVYVKSAGDTYFVIAIFEE